MPLRRPYTGGRSFLRDAMIALQLFRSNARGRQGGLDVSAETLPPPLGRRAHPRLRLPTATWRRRLLALAVAVLGASALPATAQTFPDRPVRFVVPFPPGGPVDTVARIVGQKVSEQLGQPVLVENRAGAGGIVGAEAALRGGNDGYTVFVCSIHHTVLPSLYPKLSYDIQKDFEPLGFGARFPIVLTSHPSVPATSVRELIALAKQSPGKLIYGSAGNGGGTHLAGELFNVQAGTQMLHVPYRGSAPAVADLLGGRCS